ncbi:MAG: AAA family ATPase [Myxococcota bacterium]
MEPPRPLDRLDRRIASRRLRARHVRAVARALAELRAAPVGARETHELPCQLVFVSRSRGVRFAVPIERVTTGTVAGLVETLRNQGVPRRAEQLAATYARLADDYGLYRALARLPGEPQVIAVGGRVASGKSTLAKAVARRLAAPRVATDRVRHLLLDHFPESALHEVAWSAELGERVYAGLLARGGDALAGGRSVVLDACFPRAAQRAEAAAFAAKHGAPFLYLHCEAPAADIAARLRLRDVRDGVAAGTWASIAASLDAQWEPLRETEPGQLLRIDSSQPRDAWLRALGLAKPEME